ncbi:MAG: hypothetical protein NTV30_07780 [Chloroflexi bacterium]|nr:hypothetical protein [Chloroflexota bacterium]
MLSKTENDLWFEMSVREVWTQAHFAEIAYKRINIKAQSVVDTVFSSIHSFLSHCAMISKMLKAKDDGNPPHTVGGILGVLDSSIIHTRNFRNGLEHYDRELKVWIKRFGTNVNILTYNIGPKSAININNMLFVSNYDPTTNIFTFINEDFNLYDLYRESERIKEISDNWVTKMNNGIIPPPFV